MKIINKSIVSIILALCINLIPHANALASANLSSKENGGLKDIIVSHDANIKINGNSFELEKTGDEFNYILSKVRKQ